jgi:hypothetical protein
LAPIWLRRRVIERSRDHFDLYPELLIGDTAYGLAEMLDWLGTVRNFVRRWAVQHDQAIALVKRSPKRTPNWTLAMHHSRAGMIRSFSGRFKTRKRSFVAASSLASGPDRRLRLGIERLDAIRRYKIRRTSPGRA